MMDFKEFQDQVLNDMKDRTYGINFDIIQVDKLQGESYTGLSVRPDDSIVSASLNLDQAYGQMMAGKSYEEVVDALANQCGDIMVNMPDFDLGRLTDYESMKDTLIVQVIPTEVNKAMLQDIPHKDIEDMSIVYRMQMDKRDDGVSSVLVTNAMLDNYGVTPEQLHQDAMEATVINNPATFRSMQEVLAELMGMPEEFLPQDAGVPTMYVASVEGSVNGAGVIA